MEEAGPFRLGGPPDAGWRNPVQPSPGFTNRGDPVILWRHEHRTELLVQQMVFFIRVWKGGPDNVFPPPFLIGSKQF